MLVAVAHCMFDGICDHNRLYGRIALMDNCNFIMGEDNVLIVEIDAIAQLELYRWDGTSKAWIKCEQQSTNSK